MHFQFFFNFFLSRVVFHFDSLVKHCAFVSTILHYRYGVNTTSDLPGQIDVHSALCTVDPRQGLPPLRGTGLLHTRVRFCWPLPHLELHSDHCDHGDQPPFTADENTYDINWHDPRNLPFFVRKETH